LRRGNCRDEQSEQYKSGIKMASNHQRPFPGERNRRV
jgi:hypothetical protein